MDKLLQLLLKNPIILFLVGAWLIGMISNVAKAKKRSRERRDAAARPQPVPKVVHKPIGDSQTIAAPTSGRNPGLGTGQQKALPQQRQMPVTARSQKSITPTPVAAPATPQASSPEQVAAEMRRILGLAPDPKPTVSAPRQATPPPIRRQPELIPIDPASVKVREPRVDSHVGEGMRDRHMQKSKVGQSGGKRGKIGNLGGRATTRRVRAASEQRRFALNDLRKALVLNEILSPPVSIREHSERRPI